MVTSSGEDIKDFAKIFRNKFRSSSYFQRERERNQTKLGYLPVGGGYQEGDPLTGQNMATATANFMMHGQITMPVIGSHSHNPSTNTTPVHTLHYPLRSASPGAMTQQDLVLFNEPRYITTTMLDYSRAGPSQAFQPLVPSIVTPGTSSHHHIYGNIEQPYQPAEFMPRTPLRTPADEMHNRLGVYANRLAEVEAGGGGASASPVFYRGGSLRSSLPNRGGNMAGGSRRWPSHATPPTHRYASFRQPSNTFDGHSRSNYTSYNQPVGLGRPMMSSMLASPMPARPPSAPLLTEGNDATYEVCQTDRHLLSQVAADQRGELEQIIKRLEEENRMLSNEFGDLAVKDENKPESTSAASIQNRPVPVPRRGSAQPQANIYENASKMPTARARRSSGPSTGSFSSTNGSMWRNVQQHAVDVHPEPSSSSFGSMRPPQPPLPQSAQMAREERDTHDRKVNRCRELEQVNHFLELQLNQFKDYIHTTNSVETDANQPPPPPQQQQPENVHESSIINGSAHSSPQHQPSRPRRSSHSRAEQK